MPTLERFIIKTDDIELFHLTPNLFKKKKKRNVAMAIYFTVITGPKVKLCTGAQKS